MKRRAPCRWAHRRIDNVVLYLSRRPNNHNFVLKKRAVGIVGMPKFGIKDFVERAWFESIERCKPNDMTAKILRDIISVADLGQGARRQRFVDFLTGVWWQTGKLSISHPIILSADFSVNGIRPEIHETHAVIQQL